MKLFTLKQHLPFDCSPGYTEKREAHVGKEDHLHPSGNLGKRRKQRKGKEEAELNAKG